MTKKSATKHKLPPSDRRSGKDRRLVDRGPPGRVERRRGLEPRLPEVVEREMSSSEWGELQSSPQPPRK